MHAAPAGTYLMMTRYVTRSASKAHAFQKPTKTVGGALVELQLIRLRLAHHREACLHAFKLDRQRCDATDDRALGL